ncbi:hypothetical protein [Streptomyces sp. NRRL F-5126]|uniref:hypothetical protein n=1 Tax=Streptomyces sp. NRRL F-5126 TaxID=1463857 RepID=UPI0004C83281|nr:hypothetical protein [Streptomyces sp. NRRL F-5126]
MTTAHGTSGTSGTEGWQAGVRRRLGLGRLLPLGAAEDSAWLAESAAVGALRSAVWAEAGLGRIRVGLADTAGAQPPTGAAPPAPAPPSALPPGPLRIDADFEPGRDEPLPAVAERLRAALFAHARELGLQVVRVDLRVTGLRDDDAERAARPAQRQTAGSWSPLDPNDVPGVTDVDGVAGLTRALGGGVTDSDGHLRVELATAQGHRPLDVARHVRGALARVRPEALSVAVVVTGVGVRVDAAE